MTAKGLLSTEKIVLVGAGNVATHLGTALRGAGYAVLQVFSRTEESASALAGKLNCPYTTDINQVVPDAELYVVSVKDAVLAEVIPPLVRRNPKALFVHTAGSMPMDVWKGEAVHYGVLYPMQTFSKSRAVDFSTVPFFIEGSGREEAEALKAVAERIGGKVYEATSEQRRYLHIAAVFACNFTNHMYALAHRKVHELPPLEAQTGPARRYDENVIGKHLEMLADEPRLAELYEKISQSIHRLA